MTKYGMKKQMTSVGVFSPGEPTSVKGLGKRKTAVVLEGNEMFHLLNCLYYFLILFSGEGNGTPLQFSCLENPMDRGAWRAAVRGVTRVGHD